MEGRESSERYREALDIGEEHPIRHGENNREVKEQQSTRRKWYNCRNAEAGGRELENSLYNIINTV